MTHEFTKVIWLRPEGETYFCNFYRDCNENGLITWRAMALTHGAWITDCKNFIDAYDKLIKALTPQGEVNFVQWLKGHVQYSMRQLRYAAKDRFAKDYKSLPELIFDLVYDEKLLPEDLVAPELRKELEKITKP